MAGDTNSALVHATCVAVDGRAVILLGPPGSGKSDLALRTITSGLSVGGRTVATELVADDQVVITRRGERLFGRVPETIAGRIEIRGIGIIGVAYVPEAEIRLAAEMVASQSVERSPEPRWHDLLGLRLPLLALAPFEASAPAKLVLALLNLDQVDHG